MPDTTPGRIRIETNNPDGRKRVGVQVLIDDEDISGRVTAVDFHADAHSLPTAVIHVIGAEISAETEHVTFQVHHPDGDPDGDPGPDAPLTQKDLGLLKLHLADIQVKLSALPPSPLLCIACLIDIHNGQRTTEPNPAALIINGASSCRDHFQIVDGPVLPDRTPSGILLPGQGA